MGGVILHDEVESLIIPSFSVGYLLFLLKKDFWQSSFLLKLSTSYNTDNFKIMGYSNILPCWCFEIEELLFKYAAKRRLLISDQLSRTLQSRAAELSIATLAFGVDVRTAGQCYQIFQLYLWHSLRYLQNWLNVQNYDLSNFREDPLPVPVDARIGLISHEQNKCCLREALRMTACLSDNNHSSIRVFCSSKRKCHIHESECDFSSNLRLLLESHHAS